MNKRKTKLLTTIGPATASYEKLKQLHLNGANAFRLNFSHGSHEDHLKVIQWTQQLNKDLDANIALIGDLQGPKLRIGVLKNPILLVDGRNVTFTTNDEKANAGMIPVLYAKLAEDMKPGEKIMIDDGKLELQVTGTNGSDEVHARIICGGELKSRKGFNLPDTNIAVPALTPKDLEDLDFILSQHVDWIALSFVRQAQDIDDLREIIHRHPDKKHVKIIAKIEKPQAINNLDAIIQTTDAVMIARGDLGVEIPFENVPLIQKRIIAKCIRRAVPVIIATQMMESMIDNSRPSRAEVTDVANGVLEGADVLMLSGETAIGKYPVEVVQTMDKIIRHSEKDNTIYHKNLVPDEDSKTFLSDAICFNACKMAEDVDARAVNGMTFSGYTAFMISSYRPEADIYIFTSNKAILNTLNLLWGVEVFYYDKFVGTDETIEDVINILHKKGKVKAGDIVINTASMPITSRGRTNMIKVTYVKN
ncbi:MAG: pyruvate kinase [Bacteroidetes bacterium]|nr:pyruvate kinase [Bacteroidota bacterium]